MCDPSTPPPPDKNSGLQQGAANKDAAIASAQLSNANVSNPYGDQTVEYRIDPTTGNPVPYVKQSFSPTQQGIFDTSQKMQQETANLGLTGAKNAGDILGKSFDINNIQGIDKTAIDRNSVRDALVARATQSNTIDRDNVRSKLVAQGIPVGSEAYNREMAQLDRSMVDARQQAEIGAGQAEQQAMAARQQMIQEALVQRQTPLNEIASLRTGSQLNPLQFSGVSGATVAPAPLFAASVANQDYISKLYGIDMQNTIAQGQAVTGAASKGMFGA